MTEVNATPFYGYTMCNAADVLTVQGSQWRGQLEFLQYHNQFELGTQQRRQCRQNGEVHISFSKQSENSSHFSGVLYSAKIVGM